MERNNEPSGNFYKNSGQDASTGRAIDRMLAATTTGSKTAFDRAEEAMREMSQTVSGINLTWNGTNPATPMPPTLPTIPVRQRVSAERAKHVILEEIRYSPDVRVAAAKWLTELTNEITKIVSETNQEGTT